MTPIENYVSYTGEILMGEKRKKYTEAIDFRFRKYFKTLEAPYEIS